MFFTQQKQGTMWQYLAALAVLASSGLGVAVARTSRPSATAAAVPPLPDRNPANPEPGQKDPRRPLPPEIVKAWTDAGARVGWMKRTMWGYDQFQKQGEAGAVPAFQFFPWKEGVLAKLPNPGAAFGLDLYQTQVTDTGLKELAGLKSLRSQGLSGTQG